MDVGEEDKQDITEKIQTKMQNDLLKKLEKNSVKEHQSKQDDVMWTGTTKKRGRKAKNQ